MTRGVTFTSQPWRGDRPLEQPTDDRNPDQRPSPTPRAEPGRVIAS